MNGQQSFASLDLQKNGIIDNQISAKTGIKQFILKTYRHIHLPNRKQAFIFQFLIHSHFIDTLKHAGPKIAMNIESGINHFLGQSFNVAIDHRKLRVFVSLRFHHRAILRTEKMQVTARAVMNSFMPISFIIRNQCVWI